MPDDDNQNDQTQPAAAAETAPPATWDDYAAAHPEAAPLHEAATASLKKALDSERERAKTAEKALRELAKTADPAQAEQLRKQADEMKAEADAAKAENEFITTAVRLGCRVPDKAWVFARATGMTPEQMKSDPDLSYLFAPKTADAKAGNGTGGAQKTLSTNEQINSQIRTALGRSA